MDGKHFSIEFNARYESGRSQRLDEPRPDLFRLVLTVLNVLEMVGCLFGKM